jgi:hypothetical protein
MATPEQGVTQGLHVILSVVCWRASRQNRPQGPKSQEHAKT